MKKAYPELNITEEQVILLVRKQLEIDEYLNYDPDLTASEKVENATQRVLDAIEIGLAVSGYFWLSGGVQGLNIAGSVARDNYNDAELRLMLLSVDAILGISKLGVMDNALEGTLKSSMIQIDEGNWLEVKLNIGQVLRYSKSDLRLTTLGRITSKKATLEGMGEVVTARMNKSFLEELESFQSSKTYKELLTEYNITETVRSF